MGERRFSGDQIPAGEQCRAELSVCNSGVQQVYGLNFTASSTGFLLGLVPTTQAAQDLSLVNATIARKASVQVFRGSGRDGVDPLVGALEVTDVDQCLQALTEHLRGRDRLEVVGGQEGQRLVEQGQTVGSRSASDEQRTLQRQAQGL